MKAFKFIDADIHQMPEGKIHIVHSDPKFSLGYLSLDPQRKMEQISWSVEQEIIQLKGMSSVQVFHNSDEPTEVVMHPGDYLMIPAQTVYTIDNPNEEVSLTSWKLDGDATEEVNLIRQNTPKI
jgi:hypothetical protein